ncbi:MAG: FecR domain-containing protein, partial [Bdellovibrionales bacterium]|nr:FecR domain-containing protein [Bdellovibrionales bacterium]
MDRLLLTGSISLLIIEIALLLGDLGFIPLDPFHLKENSLRQDEIGSVVQINQEVRRKSKDSLIWENSNSTDRLYAFDSILTLKNSFAKIELKNDIKLQLQENTLVVLEPSESGSKDHLRLRFARGSMRSKANKENLKIRTEEFTLEVGAESDIQLRSQGSDRFEMEVSKGEVKFQVEASSSVPSTIRAGEKVWLENSEVVDKR